MLASCLAAIGGDSQNLLGIKPANKAVVILVDGLGVSNLKFQPGHAPFLNSLLSKNSSIECAFPSTTAASITSFATGKQPGEHVVIGYQIFDRSKAKGINLLTGWGPEFPPQNQRENCLSEKAAAQGIDFVFCGPAEYAESGFTQATMRAARYLPAKSIQERFDVVAATLRSTDSQIIYLYIPELDQTAHAFGSKSDRWLEKLEELDSIVKDFTARLPKGIGVLLTADHGIVDVAESNHYFLDEVELEGLQFVGGDPRVSYLYFDSMPAQHIEMRRLALREHFGATAFVALAGEVIEAGYFGKTLTQQARALLPDIFVIAKSEIAIYHRGFSKPKSMRMIGQHGSISPAETKVPLIRFGAFA